MHPQLPLALPSLSACAGARPAGRAASAGELAGGQRPTAAVEALTPKGAFGQRARATWASASLLVCHADAQVARC